MSTASERAAGAFQVQKEHREAIKLTLAAMTPAQRRAKLQSIEKAKQAEPNPARRLQIAAVACEVAAINRELSARPNTPPAQRTSNVGQSMASAEIARALAGTAIVGAGVYGVYQLTAAVVTFGLLPWIGGGVVMVLLWSGLKGSATETPAQRKRQSITVTQTQTTIIEQ